VGYSVLLENKIAVVYGAAGPIGSSVANAFAREGADLYLAGRTEQRLERAAGSVRGIGRRAHVAQVDVLDRDTVERHAAGIVAAEGRIDVCFNAVSNDDIQGTPLDHMPVQDVLQPVVKALTSHFTIATSVGRHMARAGRGVILCMAGGREAIPHLGGSHVAWAALAGLCRQLAADLGPYGVRVAWLLSPGSPGDGQQQAGQLDEPTDGLLPNHRPLYGEVGQVAGFVASDAARTITAAEINLTGGAVID
jgi:3-oxoacyl-[acyl-carrier protein] reductase